MDVVESLFLSDNYRNFSATPQELREVLNFRVYRKEVEESNKPLTF